MNPFQTDGRAGGIDATGTVKGGKLQATPASSPEGHRPAASPIGFPALLGLLGYTDDNPVEHISICYRINETFTADVHSLADGFAMVDLLLEAERDVADVWFGLNPVAGPARSGERGKATDVLRITSLWADLDIKEGSCPDMRTAHAIVSDISRYLGERPGALVQSGHGLHPYWLLDRESAARLSNPEAKQLAARFGRMAKTVAGQHGCDADSVFDLARILRVPGSVNHKHPDAPVPVVGVADAGKPLTIQQASQSLDDFGLLKERTQGVKGARDQSSPRYSRDCLVHRVRKAPEGRRNVTLWGAVKDAGRQGDLDLAMQAALEDAAVLAGLDEAEAARTGKSAADQARSEGHDIDVRSRHQSEPARIDQNGVQAATEAKPRLWPATQLRAAAQPRWLAKNRLPCGAVSLLVGDEGIGKSLFWGLIAAAVTTGKPVPELGIPARDPANVFVVCTEDDWPTTVRPRLEVAGADLTMMSVICTEDDGSGTPVFPRDLHLITEADNSPALVVVDAWLDTVPGSLSVRDPQHARQALHPWREVATVTDAAVLLLTHTNRVSSANPRDRYGATGELRKKARMTLFAQLDGSGQLVVGPEKANTSAPIPASSFIIRSVQHFGVTDDNDGTVPLLTFAGESALTARELIADAYSAGRETGKADDVVAWLAARLADGPRWATDVNAAAASDGFSEHKVRRAKARLSVESVRKDSTGPWFWRLPQHAGVHPDGDQGWVMSCDRVVPSGHPYVGSHMGSTSQDAQTGTEDTNDE